VWLRLKAMGCDIAQGYVASRPIPADDFLRWVQSHRPPAAATAA
jgi:EAL domain-containing protein (putative c-di-GMP-specific phosphodiesterase class I)